MPRSLKNKTELLKRKNSLPNNLNKMSWHILALSYVPKPLVVAINKLSLAANAYKY